MLRSNPARVALACVATIVALAVAPAGAEESRGSVFGSSSMAGSGKATMQLETVPARVARVVVRPGTGGREAWAVGTTTVRLPGYSTESIGQVVFLKYTPATGWVVTGPPRSASGAIINPVLASFDLRPDGEGWAVGDAGRLLRKAPGSDQWVQAPQSGTVTTQTLNSVSLAPGGGYAVGSGPTILRLTGTSWAAEEATSEMAAQTTELHAVAAVSATDAWAVATGQVTGVDSTSLLIYRRGAGGWSRVTTGDAIFDSPPAKSRDGALNRSVEAGAIAANANGAWIGGRLYPRSPAAPEGDPAPGDTSRGFVLRYDNAAQQFTSYCPDLYGDRATGGVDLSRMCDEPFPTAPFHIASLSISPEGDVFAGGVGLFRFSGKGWYREPDANGYLISISMGSNSEGFAASSGRSLGSGGLIRSSSNTIGHWTARPKRSAIARWSQPQDQLLEGLAVAQDGSGRAIAVGALSAGSIFSGAAWDSINPVIGYNLHGVAWPAGAKPWAVGSAGFILRLDGNDWTVVDSPTRRSLFAVAFRSPTEGVAVGLGGTILVYQGGRWRDDSPKAIANDLYSVLVTPSGYVATGTDGAVVEGAPGRWRLRPEGRSLLKRAESPQAPTLYSATMLGDRVVIGGQDSAMLVREPDGKLRAFEGPLEGTVMSLSGAGGVLHASVTPGPQKYRGEAPAAQRGTVMRYAGGRWSDIGLRRRATLLRDQVDSAAFEDPIYDLKMTSATSGWGVGGSPADLKDPVDGQFRSLATSAAYRIDVGGDPSQPATRAELDLPRNGIPFAAFGESWCGRGLCSSSVGTGTMADEVSLQIRDEINEASRAPGGPAFVLFTGNMRRTGIPEELEQFRSYLRGFRIPVFVAPGSLDRFSTSDPTQALSAASSAGGSNDYWKTTFAAQPAPWGHAAPLQNFAPAGVDTADTVAGAARTHYAFDYVTGGRRMMRVVFVDSSTRSYGTLQQQNPPQDQSTWLAAVLAEAQDVLGIPAVVVTNQPPFLPSDEQIPNWSVFNDQQHFESTVAATRVSAVITGGPRVNAVDTIKSVVPMFVVGGGGGPLGRDLQVEGSSTAIEPASKLPTDGYYHAWHLMRLDPDDRLPVTGQARVTDEAFPILESLAMHSFFGARIPAGTTTSVTALARGPAGGFSDPDQAKTQYLAHGFQRFLCGYKGQGNGVCISRSATLPRFRFYTEDPSVASFVVRDPLDATAPRRIGGEIIADPTGADGLLCVYKLGKVGVIAEAGLHRTRIEIEGIPGIGPCVEQEVKGVREVRDPDPISPQPDPVAKENFFFRAVPRQELTVVFPPPPAPVVAPAPPGAPGVGSKEEHEAEYETESHDENKNAYTAHQFTAHQFTALAHQRRERAAEAGNAWMMLGSVALISFFAACALAAVRERRRPDGAFSEESR